MPYIYLKPTHMQCLYIFLFCFTLFFSNQLSASHARAGEVCIEYLGNHTVKAKIYTYTKIVGANGKISNEIINKVKGINRVVYDISSKPPATIEWE